ncbi:MAG: response regulator, partial [Candidatus Eremiobacterota bacterium]
MTGPRVLILEDDAVMRELLEDVLRKHGFDTRGAARADEAVELAVAEAFDLVVTDIRMEGRSGLDALEEIKERRPDLPSLVVTGYSTEADSIRAIRLGVGDYLKKPFQMHTFVEAVQRLLAGRQRAIEAARREAGLRQTALWALELFLRSLGSDRAEPSLRLLEQLSTGAGLSGPAAEELRLAVLVHLIRLGGADCPAHLLDILPGPVEHLLRQLQEERWETLEARIARLCLALRNWTGQPASPTEWL